MDRVFQKEATYFYGSERVNRSFGRIVHEVIFAELVQGCKTKNEEILLMQYCENLPKLPIEGSFLEAGKLSFANKYTDKGIGLIDSVLINQAKKHKIKIWTLDKKIIMALNKTEVYFQD